MTPKQEGQPKCLGIARHATFWVGQAPDQPAKFVAVSPVRNARLITAQKSYGRAGAMNSQLIIAMTLQVQPESFLCTAANSDNDVIGPSGMYEIEQFFVANSAV